MHPPDPPGSRWGPRGSFCRPPMKIIPGTARALADVLARRGTRTPAYYLTSYRHRVGAPAKGLLMRRLATATMGSGAQRSGATGRFGILPGLAGAARGELAGVRVGSREMSTGSIRGVSGMDEAGMKSGGWSMSSRGSRGGGGGKVDWRNGGPSRQGRSAGGRGGGRGGGAGRGGRDDVSREKELVDVTTREDVAALVEAGVVVVVLAAGKSRLFYEGNPVVFGGAVRQVVGQEPSEGGAVVAVVDHAGSVRPSHPPSLPALSSLPRQQASSSFSKTLKICKPASLERSFSSSVVFVPEAPRLFLCPSMTRVPLLFESPYFSCLVSVQAPSGS